MAGKWLEKVTGPLEEKKEYRQDKARMDALPEPHRTAAKALHRYLIYYSGIVDGRTSITMLGDLIDLWERAAVDGTSVREVVGADPVDFAESFAQAYTGRQWIDKERARLASSIARAAGETP